MHRIGARAEKKVTQELIGEFKRVAGKENLLFRVAEASVARPDGMVKDVIFPAVGGNTAGATHGLLSAQRLAHLVWRSSPAGMFSA